MDPIATLKIMRDCAYSLFERREAALSLLEWLGKGGFLPEGENRRSVVRLIEGLRNPRTLRRSAMRSLLRRSYPGCKIRWNERG